MRYGVRRFRKATTFFCRGAPYIRSRPSPTRSSTPRWLSQSYWPCLISAIVGQPSCKRHSPRTSLLLTLDFLITCLTAKSPLTLLIAMPSILAWPLWKHRRASSEHWLVWNRSTCTCDKHHRRLLSPTRYPRKTRERKRKSNRNSKKCLRMKKHLKSRLVENHWELLGVSSMRSSCALRTVHFW